MGYVTEVQPCFKIKLVYCIFFSEDIVEDQVLHKAQRGLLFGKPKYGIFVTAFYKKHLNVDDPAVHSGIVTAACDVITFALKLAAEEKGIVTILLIL